MKNQEHENFSAEERAVDGLLREHARHPQAFDEDALTALDKKLDQVDAALAATAKPIKDQTKRRGPYLAVALAACAVGGIFLAGRHLLPTEKQGIAQADEISDMEIALADEAEASSYDAVAKKEVTQASAAAPAGWTMGSLVSYSESQVPSDQSESIRLSSSSSRDDAAISDPMATGGAATPLLAAVPAPVTSPTPSPDFYETETIRNRRRTVDYDEARARYQDSQEQVEKLVAGGAPAQQLELARAEMATRRGYMHDVQEKYRVVDYSSSDGLYAGTSGAQEAELSDRLFLSKGARSLSLDTGMVPTQPSLPQLQDPLARPGKTAPDSVHLHRGETIQNEQYHAAKDNPFRSPIKAPLSTFSIDIDTASYSNARRMIQAGQTVPADAVRIEEFINYFDYAYPQPDPVANGEIGEGGHPFSVNLEATDCPWSDGNRLVRVGLKGLEFDKDERPQANLVFLIDVSGSMNSHDKLPLLKQSMNTLLDGLGEDDVVSIVVYASQEGLCLPPTDCGRKDVIKRAIANLTPGGSTNGEGGIRLAYDLARKQFVKGGVNRIVLCTDGDFNVGISDRQDLVDYVKKQANHEDGGVFLTVCGYGQGNLNDAMLEGISNEGNGNYFYVDNAREGNRVFGEELAGTLVTIAKDVKIQVEFNPSKVAQYRLIGYANRKLRAKDFADDKIDAGEIGSGHTVTALYEIVPTGKKQTGVHSAPAAELKYQQEAAPADRVALPTNLVDSEELLTVKLRYKEPEGDTSTLLEEPLIDTGSGLEDASADLRFASSVAAFGMWLRRGEHAGGIDKDLILRLAESGQREGDDTERARRAEFAELVRRAGR